MNSACARLLGFAPMVGLDALRTALNAVAGARVHACHGPGLVALLQQEPGLPLFGGGREAMASGLPVAQRRLEVACQAGAFLPMHPAAACCPAEAVSHLLEPAWDALMAALTTQGGRHQWDVALRWAAEPVLACHRDGLGVVLEQGQAAEAAGGVPRFERSRREAALMAALAPAVLGFSSEAAGRDETEIVLTLLVNSGGEAPLEAALQALPAEHAVDAVIAMRGPLPPISFSAVRVASVEARDIALAWRLLDLPDRVDLASLHRQWRQRAALVPPERRPEGAVTLSGLSSAYRLLRALLADAAKFQTLNGMLRHAGPRLVIPDDPIVVPAGVRHPAREMAW